MLTTLANVKIYLWINDTGSDTVLTLLLSQADSTIKKYLWRDIEEATYTHLFNWNWQFELLLKQYPVSLLTSFKYNSWTLWTPVRTDFNRESYNLDPEPWIIHLSFLLTLWIQNIQVVYKAWYATANIPLDLSLACIKLTSYFYNTKTSDWVMSEWVDWASINYEKTGINWLPADIVAILDLYKSYYV